jgi:hypothetical protein
VAGNQMAKTFIQLDPGMPSQVALHIGSKNEIPPDNTGTSGAIGCTSRITASIGTSTAAISQLCVKPALHPWSRFIAWRDL